MRYAVLAAVFAAAVLILLTRLAVNKKKIRDLSERINKVLSIREYENVGSFEKYTEGELAILESEIGKLICVLREQADNLQRDKRFLSDSIADISHQLKTPLTSINIVVSMLMDDDLTQEAKLGYIEEITRQLDRIDWLVQTLLKISRFDADTVVFETRRVDFKDLIGQVAQRVEIPMEIKGQRLVTDIQCDSGFEGDFGWTGEAVINIVKNCMEHMDSNRKIYITAHENTLYSSIVIEDEGRGIDREDMSHIFERFYRGKNANSSSVGIGLHLARTIISRQNGTVKAENRPEGGARFEIRLYKQIV